MSSGHRVLKSLLVDFHGGFISAQFNYEPFLVVEFQCLKPAEIYICNYLSTENRKVLGTDYILTFPYLSNDTHDYAKYASIVAFITGTS